MKRTILYLDDEEQCLEVFRLMFGGEFDVRTAGTPGEARLALASRAAEIVISDKLMPEIDGIEFLREVAEKYPASCRVLLTGAATVGGVVQQIGDGLVQFFLTKPWAKQKMLEVLERAGALLESRGGTASSW